MGNNNLDQKGNLKILPLFLCGGALFSMHFGASSMVWPMNWGKESGTSVLPAFGGAFITSLLLVIIAYVALARGNGTYKEITYRIIGKKLGLFYTCITIAVLGPLYVIPRMSAASWDSIVQAFGFHPSNRIPLIIFTIVFYLITYFFLANPGKAMDKISSLLFPILLVVVIAIVGKGLLQPISTPLPKTYEDPAFAYGFTNGYATGEVLCALTFGAVIFNSLRNKGVAEKDMTANMIRVGITGIAMLTCTHLAHMIIGANTGDTMRDLNYTALYTAVAAHHYGKIGGYLFSCALFLAALTTAIGITSGCAEFFVDLSDGKLSYIRCATVILIFSTIFGCLGLTSILSILGPILDGIYPTAIVLSIYYALIPRSEDPRRLYACKYAMIVSFIFGVMDTIWKYAEKAQANPGGIVDLYLKLPFADVSLAWVIPTVIAFIIGYLVYKQPANNLQAAMEIKEEVE